MSCCEVEKVGSYKVLMCFLVCFVFLSEYIFFIFLSVYGELYVAYVVSVVPKCML